MVRYGAWSSLALVLVLVVQAGAGSLVAGEDDQRLIVTGLSGLPLDLEAALARVGGELVRVDGRLDFAVVHAPQEQLVSLLPGHVVRDRVFQGPSVQGGAEVDPSSTDPMRSSQWALDFLDMEDAWALENGSRDVVVAIVDSGVDPDHEDLADTPISLGRDYVAGGTVGSDPHGHGTHISGIIAGDSGNGIGITGMSDVSLFHVRVLNADNSGFCSNLVSGVQDAIDEGADIINLSLGGLVGCMLPTLRTTIAASDTLIVGVTHNHWPDVPACLLQDPALDPHVIAVTAIMSNGQPASFSCRSPFAEIAAPGVSVLSTLPGDRYAYWSGTSMAAPHVAATAALMKSANPSLPPHVIRSLLIETADDSQTGSPWTEAYGHGIVDPPKAVEAAVALKR